MGVCIGSVWGVGGRVGGGGRGGEKVSLAALLSGYLGKSEHLPRFSNGNNGELSQKSIKNAG